MQIPRHVQRYLSHGVWTDPGDQSSMLSDVPGQAAHICRAVQGVLIHDYFGAHLYDAQSSGFADASRATQRMTDRLRAIRAIDPAALTQARPPSLRSVGTCRDFAVMACALFRHHGIPARVRCGFARYFHPPTFEDHWICQYWDVAAARWVSVDAELDAEHLAHLSIDFDPLDIPADEFLFPWQVWDRYRDTPDEFAQFGHGDAKGAWFVQVNLCRDFLQGNRF